MGETTSDHLILPGGHKRDHRLIAALRNAVEGGDPAVYAPVRAGAYRVVIAPEGADVAEAERELRAVGIGAVYIHSGIGDAVNQRVYELVKNVGGIERVPGRAGKNRQVERIAGFDHDVF